jgi:hypothetical protein
VGQVDNLSAECHSAQPGGEPAVAHRAPIKLPPVDHAPEV